MHLLRAMARVIFIALALLGIIQNPHLGFNHVGVSVQELVQLNVPQLSPDMAQPLHDVEQWSREQSWVAKGALLLAALQQWQLWAVAGFLLLLFPIWWFLRKRRSDLDSSSKQESSPDMEKDEDSAVGEGSDSDEMDDEDRIWDDGTQWPAPLLVDKCRVVEELVDDLLRACRGLSCHTFMPRLQSAIGVSCIYEGWSAREDNVLYRLLVPLSPPPGHSFQLELGDPEEMPARNSCLRVNLECSCRRETLLGDTLCFLHCTQEELRGKQEPSLLQTLCRGSYLNVKETALWFQDQIRAAWRHLPLSRNCRLTVLPSQSSCKIKLTTASMHTFSIEMTLGVQLDDSQTFLCFE